MPNQECVWSKEMSVDNSTMKLGKRPRRHDVRTLKLARYLTGTGQAQPLQPPASGDYTHGMQDWGMMLNDRLGCCTIAAIGHAVQTWTANALGRELTVPDSTILEYYGKWDGYNPADPATDQGGVELDVLNDWRQQGFGGVSLDAYVAIGLGAGDSVLGAGENNKAKPAPGSPESPAPSTQYPAPVPDIATAIWLFGGAYIGVELPIRAQNQDVWDVPANPGPEDEPGSWGGHAIYLVGYDRRDSGLGTRACRVRTPNSGFRIPEPEHWIPNSGFRIPEFPSPQHPAPSPQL
jgi:hypothetical protein